MADGDTEVMVIKVGSLDKYHATDLADDEMEAAQRKVGEMMLYRLGNEDMVSADAVDAIATDRFQRVYWGIDVESPVAEVVKIDPDDKSTWLWSSTARARNIRAGADKDQADNLPKVSDGWNVGVGETPYTLPEKDGNGYTLRDKDGNIVYSQKINVHARKASMRKAVRNAKMRCLGPQEIQMGLAKIKKSLEDPKVAEQIKAARRQMGHPEGGPGAAKKSGSSPPQASSSASTPTSGGGGGGDYDVEGADWGVARDGLNMPTLSQARFFSHADRGDRRMTRQEIQGKTRHDLMQLMDEIRGAGKK